MNKAAAVGWLRALSFRMEHSLPARLLLALLSRLVERLPGRKVVPEPEGIPHAPVVLFLPDVPHVGVHGSRSAPAPAALFAPLEKGRLLPALFPFLQPLADLGHL